MGPGWPLACSASIHAGQHIETDLLSVVAGEKRRARRPAAGRVVELRVADTVGRECIEVWRRDFPAVTPGIREAHVVGKKDHEVGWPRNWRAAQGMRGNQCAKCNFRQEEKCARIYAALCDHKGILYANAAGGASARVNIIAEELAVV